MTIELANAKGLCLCGCGQQAPRARKGYISSEGFRIRRGEHSRWVLNHDKRGLHPDVMPEAGEVEVAWAAGIIEGEGSFGGSRTRGSIQIHVGQSDPWILHRLQALFGGHMFKVGGVRAGRFGVRDYWTWTITGCRARGLATAIEPYLSPRRLVQLEAARAK